MESEIMIDHTYGSDKDFYGRPRDKEGTKVYLIAADGEIELCMTYINYDSVCSCQTAGTFLDINEAIQIRDFLNGWIKEQEDD